MLCWCPSEEEDEVEPVGAEQLAGEHRRLSRLLLL
jgi:hypothetical protein